MIVVGMLVVAVSVANFSHCAGLIHMGTLPDPEQLKGLQVVEQDEADQANLIQMPESVSKVPPPHVEQPLVMGVAHSFCCLPWSAYHTAETGIEDLEPRVY